jgi:twinkle protein
VPTGAYVVRRNGKTAICGNSAAWRNKADNCITVFRQKDSNEVDIHVQKIRFKDVGKIGMVTLKYDIVTGIYSEKED